MLKTNQLKLKSPKLQYRYWPPINKFENFNESLLIFINLEVNKQDELLVNMRDDIEVSGKVIHEYLGVIYSYLLGYKDSPCHIKTDDELEIKLQRAKIILERELMNHWLAIPTIPQQLNQTEAAEYLCTKIHDNSGAYHQLFDYIGTNASKAAIWTCLQHEVIRNEIVDDEVAWLASGLQGLLKKVVVSNLWDECGHGKLHNFHTYWLRLLLEESNGWEQLAKYRKSDIPWFSKIASNTFNMLLTRPGYKFMAYGYFLISESWVKPHFQRILAGMKRVEISSENLSMYFTAHLKIDPSHATELVEGVAYQEPRLSQVEINEILTGAHLAIAAGTFQYNYMLSYLSSIK
jgi:Iron-containing redox enzyme